MIDIEQRKKVCDTLKTIAGLLIDNDIWFECHPADDEIHLCYDANIDVDDKAIYFEYVDMPSRSVTQFMWLTENDNWKEHIADVIIQALEECGNG